MSAKKKVTSDDEQRVHSAPESSVPDPPLAKPADEVWLSSAALPTATTARPASQTSDQAGERLDASHRTLTCASASTSLDPRRNQYGRVGWLYRPSSNPYQPVITTVYCYKCEDICGPVCGKFFRKLSDGKRFFLCTLCDSNCPAVGFD